SVPGVFAFNGELWVIGGRDNAGRRGYPPSQEVQIYNPTTNTWHFGPILNNPRYYSTAVGVLGGRGYVVGGIDLASENYPLDYLDSMESIAYLPCGTTTPTVVLGTVTRTPTSASTAVVSPTATTGQAS